jgi:hypothetical protein
VKFLLILTFFHFQNCLATGGTTKSLAGPKRNDKLSLTGDWKKTFNTFPHFFPVKPGLQSKIKRNEQSGKKITALKNEIAHCWTLHAAAVANGNEAMQDYFLPRSMRRKRL